jgi:catechol 2,3-dioxygenase-like lactoylglutathione lyase family enzyme
MEHVGIVVDDLAAATEFFLELGLVLQGEGPVEGHLVNRVVGLGGVRADFAIMQTAAALRPYAGAQPRAWTSLRPVLERTLSVRIQETGTELSALALRCAS